MQGVYFVTDGTFTKIGVSRDVKQRIQTLQTASPRPLTVRLVLPGGADLEAHMHQRFASKRRHGEWFDLTEEDIELVRGELSPEGQRPAPTRSALVLDEETIASMEANLPGADLEFDDGDAGYVTASGDVEREDERGVRRTLAMLAMTDSRQMWYEILLQAVMLDLVYSDPRASTHLEPPLRLLQRRLGEHLMASYPELAEEHGIDWLGALNSGPRCRQYAPRVQVHALLVNATIGVPTPEFCVLVMMQAYKLLSGCRIRITTT